MDSQPAELIKVVLVEDAEDVRRVVATRLRLSGAFEVVGAGGTGGEAIRLAEEHQPGLVVLDISMPDMDGLSALPAVLKASPGTCVVMLSGFGGSELERSARALGAAGLIDKGAPLDALPDRLLQPLDESRRGAPSTKLPALPVVESADAGVLNRHLERFRTVFDQAAIGMATMTLTGTIVRVNALLTEQFGVTDGDLVGQDYGALTAPSTSAQLRAAIDRVGHGTVDLSECEHELVHHDRWLHSTFAAVRDQGGRPLYIFAQAEDVTARRESARELWESEERFRLLVESVQDYAIFMLDPHGRVNTWNLGAERMKGYRAEEIIGQHFRIFYPPEAQQVNHPERELELAVAQGRYEEEGWRVRKDGSRFWANVTITALFEESGRLAGFGKVTRDVTEQRRYLQSQQAAAAELQNANSSLQATTDAMADFVAIVAHELRSPVTAITGAAELLRVHWDRLEATDREEILSSITLAGARLQGLVNDLLTASRLEAGAFDFQLQALPVAETVAGLLDELRAANDCAIDLVTSGEYLAWADRDRFQQILTNLVNNAARHGEPPVRLEVAEHDGNVEVRVYDAGTGIAAGLDGRLFEKFARRPEGRAQGSGLGLFIVRELARGQGGEAWYASSPGEPTCFAFRLPSAAGEVVGSTR